MILYKSQNNEKQDKNAEICYKSYKDIINHNITNRCNISNILDIINCILHCMKMLLFS